VSAEVQVNLDRPLPPWRAEQLAKLLFVDPTTATEAQEGVVDDGAAA
jgi:hypothetical protein